MSDHDETPSAALASLLDRAPFAGQATLRRSKYRAVPAAGFAIAVPVREEEALLPRCLDALAAAMGQAGIPGAVAIVVHDSADASYPLVERWMDRHGIAGVVADCAFDPSIRDAPHARRLAMDLAANLAPEGALFTTDADSHVAPRWIAQGLAALAGGTDLACEDIMLDEGELDGLPPRVRAVGNAEREYFRALEGLWQRWTLGAAGAFAHRASGASMAIAAPVYRAIGGLPLPPVGEDRALCEAVLRGGGRVMTLSDGGTRTSARLGARASGGCGEALADRARDTDPVCDGRLVPVETLRDLARAALAGAGEGHARRAGTCEAETPLRYSEVLAELAEARRLLEPLEVADGG